MKTITTRSTSRSLRNTSPWTHACYNAQGTMWTRWLKRTLNMSWKSGSTSTQKSISTKETNPFLCEALNHDMIFTNFTFLFIFLLSIFFFCLYLFYFYVIQFKYQFLYNFLFSHDPKLVTNLFYWDFIYFFVYLCNALA